MKSFSDFGINITRTHGHQKTTCPRCSHDRRKAKDTCLSVNIDEQIWNCHHCGWSGTLKESIDIGTGYKKKEYKVPEFNNTKVSDQVLEWFKLRGISKSTVMRFGITESVEFMPQDGKKHKCINFNYYRDEKLVNVKYRTREKNFKMASGAELIFYNLDMVAEQKEIIICEGEVDALSFYEAGFSNIVSVPNGASKGNNKLEYLDNCWQYFEHCEKIVLAVDQDEAGAALREELARRLGKERCWVMLFDRDTKDCNELLMTFGAEGVKYCYERMIEYPLEGISTGDDLRNEVFELNEKGFPKGYNLGTKFWIFNQHLTFRPGEITMVTGIPGSGKSEFVDQIIERLASLHEWKTGIFSAENQPLSLHVAKLVSKYTQKPFYGTEDKIKPDELGEAMNWVNENFFFLQMTEENCTVDGILNQCKHLVRRKGIRAFILDPYNYIEHKRQPWQTETEYVSEFMTRFSMAAKTLGIHFFITAHPTKIQKGKDGKYEVPTLYNISGSANFFNKTDNGFCVYRDFENNAVTVYVQKVRFKFIGKIGSVELNYDTNTGCYSEKEKINGYAHQESTWN